MNLQPEEVGNPEFLSPLYQLALDQFYQSAQALNLSDNLILSNYTEEYKEVLLKEKLRNQVKDMRTHPEK